jgi:hypothetical protein
MNDMERRKFEDSFQEAFRNAELNPSEKVWTNIELDLERAHSESMKKRIVFFKMLAAASVVFALCAGGLTYYLFSDNNSSPMIAQQKILDENQTTEAIEKNEANNSVDDSAETSAQLDGQQGLSNDSDTRASQPNENGTATKESSTPGLTDPNSLNDNKDVAQQPDTKDKKDDGSLLRNESQGGNDLAELRQKGVEQNGVQRKSHEHENPSSIPESTNDNSQITSLLNGDSNNSALAEKGSVDGEARAMFTNPTDRPLPKFFEPTVPELELQKSTADPGMVLLARLAEEERKYGEEKKVKKSESEGLWTSVGFAAGAFAANNPNVTPAPSNSFQNLMANTVQTAAKQSKASGTSYSLGVSLGTKISERWVVQGGINYLTQSSDYTANSVVVIDNNYSSLKAESLNAFTGQIADASAQPKVVQTYPYNVNNNVRFVSVPVQAGYLLLDRKFGVQLNAGVSTDLFLQNTITPDGGGVSKTTQGRGEDSPYRSLNFSGLMGTELSYRLGSRYRVSLNPGLRYPFKSVYKDNMGIDATPLTFDVGLRFRYIFH